MNKILQRQKSLLRRLCLLAQIILVQFNIMSVTEASEGIKLYEEYLLHLMETRGTLEMIKANKIARNQVMRYVLGNPLLGAPGVDETG